MNAVPKSIWHVPLDDPEMAFEIAAQNADERMRESVHEFEAVTDLLCGEPAWRDRLTCALYAARDGDAKEVLALLSNAMNEAANLVAEERVAEWKRRRGKCPRED